MSESHHGRKRQAPARSPNPSNTNDDLSGDDHSSIPGTATYILQEDGSYAQKSRTRRRRKRFDPTRKAEVAEVRKVGACKTCKSRKVRVSQPVDGDCQTSILIHILVYPRPDENQSTLRNLEPTEAHPRALCIQLRFKLNCQNW